MSEIKENNNNNCENAEAVKVSKIELTEQSEDMLSRQDTSIEVKANFCKHVGFEGVIVLMFLLLVSGLFGFLIYIYTVYFNNFDREFVWVFMFIGLIYFLAMLWLIITWKKMAKDYLERATARRQNRPMKTWLFNIYSQTFINGRFFLWKLYIIEFGESLNQLVNFFTIYLCSLPVFVSSAIGIGLGIDSLFRGYSVLLRNTPIRRDRQIIIDILVDFLCVAIPSSTMWFGYRLPISVPDMIQITIMPAICLLTKLRSIFKEVIRVKCVQAVIRKQNETASNFNRRRQSIYSLDETILMAKRQQKSIPYKVRRGFVVYNVLYGVLVLGIGIFQLIAQNRMECYPSLRSQPILPELLWDACIVKTPYCKSSFKPTCNCVILNVQKHNWTTLPIEIQEMNALKVMQINHGMLNEIPNAFDIKFDRLVRLDLSYNKLPNVPDSLGNMKLSHIKLANNKITSIPESIWKSNHLFWFELDNNNISKIPSSIQNAKSLTTLLLSNNSLIDLPVAVFSLRLTSLVIDGNELTEISEKIGDMRTLFVLHFHNNNNISMVPNSIGNLLRLRQLDLRNNAIKDLPNEAMLKLKKSLKYLYLHNNPICINGWLNDNVDVKNVVDQSAELYDAGCIPQCSKYCQNRYLDSKTCGRECNSKACDFQNGVCAAQR